MKESKREIEMQQKIWLKRALQRMVNYQIKEMADGKPISDVIYLDSNCILRSKDERINHIIRLQEDGIFENNQFKDAKTGLTQKGYNRWYDKTMENTFFNTIKANDIFKLNVFFLKYNDLGNLFLNHGSEELNREVYGGYSIYKILKSLKHIDPFLLFNLLFKNVSIEKINDNEYITGIFENKDGKIQKFASQFSSKNIYLVNENNNLKEYMDMHEFMFKYYKKQIFEVINSTNNALDYFLCPEEGLGKYSYDDDICDSVKEIASSKTYKKVKEEKMYL